MKLLFLIIIFPMSLWAQKGYNQWLAVQGTEMHLLGNYKEKRVYGSNTGDKANLSLKQVQRFEKGRLVEDKMYVSYPNNVMYDMAINYQDNGEAIGLNRKDSSKVTYAFTKDKKIRYYVVDRQSDTHVIYTYNEDGLLIRCKDCIAPFGNYQWCAYFTYTYNDNKQLIEVASYNLEKNKSVDTKTLFGKDSLVYKDGKLIERLILSSTGAITQKATYHYNKKGLLVEEKGTQLEAFVEPRSYEKQRIYHCNKQLKKMTELYLKNDKVEGKQIAYYDKKGRKIKQESFRDGVRTKLYEIKYK